MPRSTINFPEVKIENIESGAQYTATLLRSEGYTAFYDVVGVPMPPNPRPSEYVGSEDKIYEFYIYLNGVKYPKSAYVTVLGDKDDLTDLEFRVTRFESENPVLPPDGGNAHFLIEINATPADPGMKSQTPVVDVETVVDGSNSITGTGIPGGVITVRVSGVVKTVSVEANGTWECELSTSLIAGDVIIVSQKHDGLAESDEVEIIIE